MFGFLTICFCGIMGTELRETPPYIFTCFVGWQMLSVSDKKQIYKWEIIISLPILKWTLNTAMTVSLIQF